MVLYAIFFMLLAWIIFKRRKTTTGSKDEVTGKVCNGRSKDEVTGKVCNGRSKDEVKGKVCNGRSKDEVKGKVCNGRSKDEVTGKVCSVRSKEIVFWSIDHITDKLTKTDSNFISPVFSFAMQEWRLVFKRVSDDITLNLEKKCTPLLANDLQSVEWSVGIKGADKIFYYRSCGEAKAETFPKWTSVGQWTGPSLPNLQKKSKLFMPHDALTFFVWLSTHEGPIPDFQAEQSDDEDKFYTDAKKNHEKNDKQKEQMCHRNKVLENLSQNLKDLYVAGKECDVTIKVENETFGAHRVILSARTPVLAAMFSHDMLEAETGAISVEDCDPKAFAVFLQFLYSGELDILTRENVVSVYYVADKYDLPDLKEGCLQCMLSTLDLTSVISIISLAARHCETQVLEKAIEFFLKNARGIFPTVQWQRFMLENPVQANELIIKAVNCHESKRRAT